MTTAGPTVGWYGKTPSTGDFISRGLSRSVIDRLDGWLQAGMTAIREQSPDAWQEHYASAPIWDAVLPSGIVTSRACVAVVAPSIDRVGRRFPLSVIVTLTMEDTTLSQFTSLPDYCADMSRIVEASIRNSISADEFDQQLDRLTSQSVRDDADLADLSDITEVLGDAGLDSTLATVPLTARSVFPWPDLIQTFDPNARTSYWWCNSELGRALCGFTHEGTLDARLFATLFGASASGSEYPRPRG
jgi:type VI secretion system protein ImpM